MLKSCMQRSSERAIVYNIVQLHCANEMYVTCPTTADQLFSCTFHVLVRIQITASGIEKAGFSLLNSLLARNIQSSPKGCPQKGALKGLHAQEDNRIALQAASRLTPLSRQSRHCTTQLSLSKECCFSFPCQPSD